MSVAIITGASRGLGRALAFELAGRGWALALDARGAADLDRVAADLAGRTEVAALPGDVRDPDHRAELVAAAEALGGLDLLVNNASALGAAPLVPLAELGTDGLREALETNLVAPFDLVRRGLPALRAAGGAVVNVSSDAAVEGYPNWGGYGASKAGLEQLSAVLAAEEPALRVWWVDPGDMDTVLFAEACPDEALDDRLAPEDVAPAFGLLLDQRPPSGRYLASELVAAGAAA